MLNRLVVALAYALALGLAIPGTALAQTYPAKPIRLIIPFPPGGSADTIARLLAQEMSKSLGQPVVAENRPGAGGNIGVDVVAKSTPDGYTIGLAAAGALVINQHLMGKLPYDPVKDLAPVSKLADIPIVVAVANSTPAGSVQDLIAAAKAKPGGLSFGSAGNGTAMHLSGELFKQMAGVDMTHVPYKGSAPAVTDLVSGQLPVAFVDLVSALPQIRAGRVKGLAVASGKRDDHRARPADDRRGGRAGLRRGRLVRAGRAGGHAARYRREAQRRDGAHHGAARSARPRARYRRRARDRHGRRVRRVHRDRAPEVGAGGEGVRREGELASQRRRSMVPVIDVHTHMLTHEWVKMLESHGQPHYTLQEVRGGLRAIHLDGAPFMTPVPAMFDWDLRVANMSECGVDIAVVSLTCPNVFWGGPGRASRPRGHERRDGEGADRVPGPHPLVRSLPWQHAELATEELEARARAGRIRRDGARQHRRQAAHRSRVRAGVEGDRRESAAGAGSPDRAARRRRDGDARVPAHRADRLHVRHVARDLALILDGFFDRFPNLKLIASHGAGALPYLIGRLDICWDNIPACRAKTTERPSSYMRRVYADSVVFAQDALEMACACAGRTTCCTARTTRTPSATWRAASPASTGWRATSGTRCAG